MRAEDVTHTPERSCRPQAAIRPVSGTNPGSCRTTAAAVVADLVDGLDERKSAHIRGAPGQPQTQGKIERWHQTLKNPIRLENYDLPGDLDAQIKASVERYTHRRDHESIDHRIPPRRFRPWPSHPARAGTQQPPDHPPASLASPPASRIRSAHPMSRSLRSVKPPSVLNASTTDRGRDLKNWMRRRNLSSRWLCRVIVVINAAPFSGLFCCSPQGGATRVGR